ncbi:cupin domain-containing protein [Desulforhopalus singaporensis]|uniref:Cupin domain-containing protein n=1 Tax=Desulforhopalus singaporensis TaxID=91360 RepID=A0A1H0KTY4_9BACT|nr:cupin domain-containing protein [Desulforhopalus singaporensis]SDO59252.1 Cupin domain-containing protein [Desulforhopalus singaporensis]
MRKKFTKCHFDFDNLPWLTSPRKQLELEAVALGFINIGPNEGYTFTHTHRQQEEVYMVIKGEGLLQLDDELLPIAEGDVVRVSHDTRRALKAEGRGLFVICCGGVDHGFPKNPNARYLIDDGVPDYDDIPSWYKGDQEVVERNSRLKQRLAKPGKKK